MINLNLEDEDEEAPVKPNHVEKLSLALAHSLRQGDMSHKMHTKPNDSKSVVSDQEDSISMGENLDNISDAYNDKLKRELELTLIDLTKIRKEYEELTQENLGTF